MDFQATISGTHGPYGGGPAGDPGLRVSWLEVVPTLQVNSGGRLSVAAPPACPVQSGVCGGVGGWAQNAGCPAGLTCPEGALPTGSPVWSEGHSPPG